MFFGLRTLLSFAIPMGICLIGIAAVVAVSITVKRNLVRIPVFFLSSPVAILAFLFVVAQIAALGCETRSSPIFSPDSTKAVVVENESTGALGGWTALELLTMRGLSSHIIFDGDWGTVEAKDIHWRDSSHVTIRFNPTGLRHNCQSTWTVQVICTPQDPPSHSGYLPSPDGTLVVALRKAKDGSYDGTDAVAVLEHGWDADFLYVGDPNSVVWTSTRWTGNRELEITYKGKVVECEKSSIVHVTCTRLASGKQSAQ